MAVLRRGGKNQASAANIPNADAVATLARRVLSQLTPSLNSQQKLAVLAPPGPILLLAGAGSGKTRVLVARMVALMAEHGALPSELVALTFSTRAAQEMDERLLTYGGRGLSGSFLGTFHALGLKLCREFHLRLGFKHPPRVLDEHSRIGLLMSFAGKFFAKNVKCDPLELAELVSRLKDKGLTPSEFPDDTDFGPKLPKVVAAYEEAKTARLRIDFEDLLRLPAQLFRRDSEVSAMCKGRWKHFLIDEFQDSSQSQLELLRCMAGNSSVFAVGDDDQTIYAWRGADLSNLMSFETHFRGAKILKLEENYRSSANIIQASNAVIRKNPLRRDKLVHTRAETGLPLYHHVADDEPGERQFISEKLKEFAREGRDLREVAILLRNNLQIKEWLDHFTETGLPFTVKGSPVSVK